MTPAIFAAAPVVNSSSDRDFVAAIVAHTPCGVSSVCGVCGGRIRGGGQAVKRGGKDFPERYILVGVRGSNTYRSIVMENGTDWVNVALIAIAMLIGAAGIIYEVSKSGG